MNALKSYEDNEIDIALGFNRDMFSTVGCP